MACRLWLYVALSVMLPKKISSSNKTSASMFVWVMSRDVRDSMGVGSGLQCTYFRWGRGEGKGTGWRWEGVVGGGEVMGS